jgi:ATP-dependent Clp protease adaptor protein ClpS
MPAPDRSGVASQRDSANFIIISRFFKDLIKYWEKVDSKRLIVRLSAEAILKECRTMNDLENTIIEQTRGEAKERLDEPPMYRVVFFNDDFTPKAFVVEILVTLFHKGAAEATELMWRVHNGRRGVAGIYPREIAETKVAVVTALARENGFPLKMTLEPDD